jgi:hypothetical protein
MGPVRQGVQLIATHYNARVGRAPTQDTIDGYSRLDRPRHSGRRRFPVVPLCRGNSRCDWRRFNAGGRKDRSGFRDQPVYLCVVEQAAGLHYDNQVGAWRPQAFGTSRKYILRKLNEDDRDHQKGKWWSLFEGRPKATWAFFEFGRDGVPKATCVELFDCQPLVSSASFDKDTHRFEMIYHGGYIDQGRWERLRQENPKTHLPVDPANPDDLFIEIGKCSPNVAAAAPILPNQTK